MRITERTLLTKTIEHINDLADRPMRIMEVCGTHTRQIAHFGIKTLLHPNIRLVSGPGCPVCVTEKGYIDALISLSQQPNMIIATFGDLFRIPGSITSLAQQKAEGRHIVTLYSPEDALLLASQCPKQQVVFAAVGFETTAPIFAALVKTTEQQGVQNLSLLTSLKRMPPAIRYLLQEEHAAIDGMLCPGHVAAVIGARAFMSVFQSSRIPAVICGFEEIDLIASIAILCRQIVEGTLPDFTNLYKRCVREEGNTTAIKLIEQVFEHADGNWRGIGTIGESALVLRKEYARFDASKKFDVIINQDALPSALGCVCEQILTGRKTPDMCVHFAKNCTPQHPLGPCMVSSEGACGVQYRYGGTVH